VRVLEQPQPNRLTALARAHFPHICCSAAALLRNKSGHRRNRRPIAPKHPVPTAPAASSLHYSCFIILPSFLATGACFSKVEVKTPVPTEVLGVLPTHKRSPVSCTATLPDASECAPPPKCPLKAIGHLAVLCATWRSRTWRRANSCLSRLKSTIKITTSPLGARQSRIGLQRDPRTQTPELRCRRNR
jgi:hypothetical protein